MVPPHWLQTIAAFCAIPAGLYRSAGSFSPLRRGASGGWLIEIFQSLGFHDPAGSRALRFTKTRSMCNEAPTWPYTRRAFEAGERFAGIDSIASGDDMLLMHKIYKRPSIENHVPQIAGSDRGNNAGEQYPQCILQSTHPAGPAKQHSTRKAHFGVLLLVYLFNLLLGCPLPGYSVTQHSTCTFTR